MQEMFSLQHTLHTLHEIREIREQRPFPAAQILWESITISLRTHIAAQSRATVSRLRRFIDPMPMAMDLRQLHGWNNTTALRRDWAWVLLGVHLRRQMQRWL